MKNYKIFSIPRHIIPDLSEEAGIEQFWEMYDDECQRKRLYLKDKVLSDILSLSGLGLGLGFQRKGNNTIHYIRYNLKHGKYIIDEHRDSCNITIIIYLSKSNSVSDQFWVEKNKIDMNKVWKNNNEYQCLIFWGNSPHHGKIHGEGSREILCFFTD